MKKPGLSVAAVAASFLLGMTSFFPIFAAGEAFKRSPWDTVAASVAAVLYLAYCQFWTAPKGGHEFKSAGPTVAAMIVPMVLFFGLSFLEYGPDTTIWSIAISGCLGVGAGAVMAGRLGPTTPPEPPAAGANARLGAYRRVLMAGSALSVGAALAVAVWAIPAVRSDSSPLAAPTGAAAGLWVGVALSLLTAAFLASAARRNAGSDRIATDLLGFPAVFAVIALCLFFVVGASSIEHGPALRTASILLLVSAIAEFLTAVLATVITVVAHRASLAGD